jgi:hypothetical protein
LYVHFYVHQLILFTILNMMFCHFTIKTTTNGFLKSWRKLKLKLGLLKVELLKLDLNDGLLNLFSLYKTKDDALRSSLCLFNSSSYHNFIVLVNIPMFPNLDHYYTCIKFMHRSQQICYCIIITYGNASDGQLIHKLKNLLTWVVTFSPSNIFMLKIFLWKGCGPNHLVH